MWLHGDDVQFPDPAQANEDGVVAVGGLVTPRSLRRAYRRGIFPWPMDAKLPILWFCPEDRFVLELDALHVSRSLRKRLRSGIFEVRFDTAFEAVMRGCAARRRRERGTWIDGRMLPGYVALHLSGRIDGVSAHSVETWRDGRLVGGLYGVAAGGVFCGESMFALEPDASKVALVALVERMRERGFALLDCQVYTEHLAGLGAVNIDRTIYLERLAAVVDSPCVLAP